MVGQEGDGREQDGDRGGGSQEDQMVVAGGGGSRRRVTGAGVQDGGQPGARSGRRDS